MVELYNMINRLTSSNKNFFVTKNLNPYQMAYEISETATKSELEKITEKFLEGGTVNLVF